MPLDAPFINYILILALSYAVAVLAIPSIILVAKRRRLFDEPDDFRKLHASHIPNLGGIAIFCAFAFVTALFNTDKLLPTWNYLFAATLILFVTGLKDDIIGLDPYKKFGAQFIASLILVYFADIRLTDLHGLLGIHQLPYVISLGLSILGIMFITNAYNLIDGIDGLAGGLGLLAFSFFAAYFASVGKPGLAFIGFAMTGALLGFLRFNVAPARIFMGDTGSLLLGFIVSALSIWFVETGAQHSVLFYRGSAGVVIAFAIIIIPVFDTMRVFFNRIIKGASPFKADRNHIHHILLDLGMNHAQASAILLAVNIFFLSVAYLIKGLNPTLSVGALFLLATALFQVPLKLRQLRLQRQKTASLALENTPDMQMAAEGGAAGMVKTVSPAVQPDKVTSGEQVAVAEQELV